MSAAPAICCNAVLNPGSDTSYSPRARQYTGPRPRTWPQRTHRPPPSIPTAPPSWSRSGCCATWPSPPICATWPCAISTSPGPTWAAASGRRPRAPPCSSRSRAKPLSASARMSVFSAPITRRPMAPASATTSTSRIWRAAHLAALDHLRRDGSERRAQLRLRARLQRAPGTRQRAARGGPHGSRSVKNRGVPGTPPYWWPRPTGSATAGLEPETRRSGHHRAQFPGLGSQTAAGALVGLPQRDNCHARRHGRWRRIHNMRFLWPKSLSGLMLLGVAVIAVPLLVAIFNAALQIQQLADSTRTVTTEGIGAGTGERGPDVRNPAARAGHPALPGAGGPQTAGCLPRARCPADHLAGTACPPAALGGEQRGADPAGRAAEIDFGRSAGPRRQQPRRSAPPCPSLRK